MAGDAKTGDALPESLRTAECLKNRSVRADVVCACPAFSEEDNFRQRSRVLTGGVGVEHRRAGTASRFASAEAVFVSLSGCFPKPGSCSSLPSGGWTLDVCEVR